MGLALKFHLPRPIDFLLFSRLLQESVDKYGREDGKEGERKRERERERERESYVIHISWHTKLSNFEC